MNQVKLNEDAAFTYLLSLCDANIAYYDLMWMVNRINFKMCNDYHMFLFSEDTLLKIYYADDVFLTGENIKVNKDLLCEAGIEVTDSVFKRWKIYGQWLVRLNNWIYKIKTKL